jgi:hypothetical protein
LLALLAGEGGSGLEKGESEEEGAEQFHRER